MKKRLSLAVALLAGPSLLILDEPTVGIDPLLRRRIWDQFRRLKAQGKTIIITTHVMESGDVRPDRAHPRRRRHRVRPGGRTEGAHQEPPIEDLFFESGATGA